MFICVIRIYQQHIRRIMVHIFLGKCLQPIWLQSTFNNTNRSPSQCRASGMGFLCLVVRVTAYVCCLRSKISQIARHTQETRKTHNRTRTQTYGFYPAGHTQRPAVKNWHAQGLARRTYVSLVFSLPVAVLKW